LSSSSRPSRCHVADWFLAFETLAFQGVYQNMIGVTALSISGVGLSGRGMLLPASLLLAAVASLLCGCGQRTASAEPPPLSQEPGATTLQAQLQPLPSAASTALEEEVPELRRGYGVVDMRFEACVTAQGDAALRGEACPPGFLVYGPYVNVPANAEIEVAFEIQPTQKVELYADIVAQMGKQGLAGLNSQVLEPGITYKLGYRVNTFRPDPFVESRIGFRAATPVGFTITNYTMTVR
jgi:hypothetical protein